MADAGIRTGEISPAALLDDVLGNREGSTVRVSLADLGTQLAGSGPVAAALEGVESQITSGLLSRSSWTAFSALSGAVDGTGGEVPDGDTGTHDDATATGYDGAEVPNAGRYSWNAAWSRWVRIGPTGLAGKANASDLAPIATSGAYGDLSDPPDLGSAAATDADAYATAAQGTDSREWTGQTVSQPEAEAGVATDRRAWSAVRVWQSVSAWVRANFGATLANADAKAVPGEADLLAIADSAASHAFRRLTFANLWAYIKSRADTVYQPQSGVLSDTTASFTTALHSKLDAIAPGATANASNADLRDRAAHTGAQAIGTVTGLQGALDGKATPSSVAAAVAVETGRAQSAETALDARMDRIAIADVARPGEAPAQFSSALTGEPEDRAPITDGAAAVDALAGKVWALPGSATLAPRRAHALTAAAVYRLRVTLRVITDSADPSGDAVQLVWQNLGKTKAAVSQAVLNTWDNPVIGDGLLTVSVLISRDAEGPGVEYAAPASARYGTPAIVTNGNTAVIGVVSFEWLDVSDIVLGGADVADLRTDLDAEAAARASADQTLATAAASARAVGDVIDLVDIAGTDTITATVPAGYPTATATTGTKYVLAAAATNVGPVTLAIGDGDALPVLDNDGDALIAGELIRDRRYLLRLSGTGGAAHYRVLDSVTAKQYAALLAADTAGTTARQALDTRLTTTSDHAWQRIIDADTRQGGGADLPAVAIGTRLLRPTAVSYDMKVTAGVWEDTGLPWASDGRDDELALLPDVQIVGTRRLRVEAYSYDLVLLRGQWEDTGLPWDASGVYDDIIGEVAIAVDGVEIVPTLISYDLRVLQGLVAATGQPWPTADALSPPMEAVFSADALAVYIHQFGNTYVKWSVAHDVVPARNADVWRVNGVHEATRSADGSYTQGQEVCFNGETEIAILLAGKPDHIGGSVHGNHELTDFYVLVDGRLTDHTVAGAHECERFEMVQRAEMFEVGDTEGTEWSPKGDHIMDHACRWTWTPEDQLRLRQHVEVLPAAPSLGLYNAYFGMLCLGYGTRGYDAVQTGAWAPLWSRIDLTGGYTESYVPADHVTAWGARYAASVRMTRGWDSAHRNLSIDDRTDRRKIYPDFFGGDGNAAAGETLTVGHIWDVETVLSITIKET